MANPAVSQKAQYQHHIHVFRGLAIVLIVCAHTVPSLDWSGSQSLGRFLDGIANQSSILFFFIAGYLFQHLSARFEYGRYLRQKLLTVLLPYLILSVPALFVFTLLTKRSGMWPGFYDMQTWAQVCLFLLTGKHLVQLWFVPTITMFYLAAPVFLYVDRNFVRGYWVILPLLVLSTCIGRGGQLGPLNFALFLLPVYLLGMAFSHFKDEATELVGRYRYLLVGVVLLSLVGYVQSWRSPPYWQMPMKVAMAMLMTVMLLRYARLFGSRLDYIADLSFGIFFIHAYYISIIKMAMVYVLYGRVYAGEGVAVVPGSLLNFGAYAGLVLVLSVMTLWLARRLLGSRSRMVVGA